jgi:hypothetical protein
VVSIWSCGFFPKPFQAEYGVKAKTLHHVLDGQDWIEEVFAASGSIGAGPSSIWVFKLNDFSALDKLLGGEDPVSEAHVDFFGAMEDVNDFIQEAIIFA